jgi:hypothetical protein
MSRCSWRIGIRLLRGTDGARLLGAVGTNAEAA